VGLKVVRTEDILNLYHTGSSVIYDIKKQKEQLQSFMASSGSLKDLLKWQALKEPKMAQLEELYQWLTVKRTEGKP
jgi:transcriptional accessory protein Tex/SPT6